MSKPHCNKCNNRLTVNDVAILDGIITSVREVGSHLSKDQLRAYRRLVALNVPRSTN